MNDPTELPLKEVHKVPFDWLALDRKNPRFTPGKMPSSLDEVGIIKNLDNTADLGELIQSISASGFFEGEPLIVTLEDGALVVLEGNRRLAAVLCLLKPELAAEARLQVPEISANLKPTLEKLPVYRVERREDAHDIIGFKHINGPRPWDAYAKADFAAKWLEQETDKPNGLTLREIAERMGDNNNTLRRMVHAMFVLRQAEDEAIWTIEDRTTRNFAFSHLYTGLSYPSFASFIGLRPFTRNEDPIPRPVARDNFDALQLLLSWLYGDKRVEEEPIIETQAKDLGRIRDVLESREATSQLMAQRSLNDAYITAQPKGELFRKHLFDSKRDLENALSAVGGFDASVDEDLTSVSSEVQSSAQRLHRFLLAEIAALHAEDSTES